MSRVLVFNFILIGIISSFIFFIYRALKLSKSKENLEGIRNCICLIIVIICFDVFYIINSILIGYPLIPYPFDALMLIWIGMIISAQILFKIFHKKKEELPNIYLKKGDFTLKLEIQRKITHMVILALIAIYLGLGKIIFLFIDIAIKLADDINFNFWGIIEVNFPDMYENWSIAIFGTIAAVILIVIPELFRLFSQGDYMLYKAEKLMREDERFAPSAPVALSLSSLVPIVAISSLAISMAAVTIAIIGDAAASICGRKYGKHKISFYPSKSYEGLIGGIFFGFITGFVVLIFTLDLFISLILALIGAILLGIIDLLNIKISDNILNPIIIGFGMYLFSFLYI